MDLRLFLRILRRFRAVFVAGLLVAILLSVLSVAKVSANGGKPTLTYRKPLQYESDTTLFVTQPGFPWGRGNVSPSEPGADPGRYANLAIVYSQFVSNDFVRREARAPYGSTYEGVPLPDGNGGVLNFILIKATSASPGVARALAGRVTSGLQNYIAQQQAANGITPKNRVILQVTVKPTKPHVAVKPSITRPLFVFILVMSLVFGLVLVLENLRPHLKAVQTNGASADEHAVRPMRERSRLGA